MDTEGYYDTLNREASVPTESEKPIHEFEVRLDELAEGITARMRANQSLTLPEAIKQQQQEIDESELSDEEKETRHRELEAFELTLRALLDGESDKEVGEAIKIAVKEAQPAKYFSTNFIPFGVTFRMKHTGTVYVRTKHGLRRCNNEGVITSRNRRVRGNAAKSLERTTRSGTRLARVKVSQ